MTNNEKETASALQERNTHQGQEQIKSEPPSRSDSSLRSSSLRGFPPSQTPDPPTPYATAVSRVNTELHRATLGGPHRLRADDIHAHARLLAMADALAAVRKPLPANVVDYCYFRPDGAEHLDGRRTRLPPDSYATNPGTPIGGAAIYAEANLAPPPAEGNLHPVHVIHGRNLNHISVFPRSELGDDVVLCGNCADICRIRITGIHGGGVEITHPRTTRVERRGRQLWIVPLRHQYDPGLDGG